MVVLGCIYKFRFENVLGLQNTTFGCKSGLKPYRAPNPNKQNSLKNNRGCKSAMKPFRAPNPNKQNSRNTTVVVSATCTSSSRMERSGGPSAAFLQELQNRSGRTLVYATDAKGNVFASLGWSGDAAEVASVEASENTSAVQN